MPGCTNNSGNGEASRSRPSTSCGTGTQPCPKCCCCVTSAAIANVRAFGAEGFLDPTPPPMTMHNGHAFDFRISMAFAAGASGTSDCTMEWWEKVNVPAISGHPPNAWTEMYALSPGSPTFGPWTNRVVPCPGGGTLNVTILDPPSLGTAPGRTITRTLQFRLVVRSGGGCTCANASKTATATQVLVMVNGVLDASASSFVVD
jgi:hypothetical protein